MYKSIDSLRAHQKLMHQNNLSAVTVKSYICEYCGKSFTKRFLLKAHMYRHSGEQPFPCHLCPKKFVARYSLKLHLRRHAGIKSYSCSLCSTQKSTGAELKAHINQYHTQEKTYPCKECPAVFNGYRKCEFIVVGLENAGLCRCVCFFYQPICMRMYVAFIECINHTNVSTVIEHLPKRMR